MAAKTVPYTLIEPSKHYSEKNSEWVRTPRAKKQDMVSKMCKLTGINKQEGTLYFDAFMAVLEHELLNGRRLAIQGVGEFQFRITPRRLSKHPFSGDYVITPPRRSMRFKISYRFKYRIKNLTDEWTPKPKY